MSKKQRITQFIFSVAIAMSVAPAAPPAAHAAPDPDWWGDSETHPEFADYKSFGFTEGQLPGADMLYSRVRTH